MEHLFRNIPTAKAVREQLHSDTEKTLTEFANKVQQAMERLSDESFTIQATPDMLRVFRGFHGEELRKTFESKNWKIELVTEEKFTEFFKISMYFPTSYQPMSD